MSRLRKLESIVIPKIILSIHTMQLGQVVCFAFSDGTVQYRDRLTMNEIYNEPNINRIMALSQVGFQFAEESPCMFYLRRTVVEFWLIFFRKLGIQLAFSPTNCSFVQVCEDNTLKWNSMKYASDDVDTAMQDSSQYQAPPPQKKVLG